jgi:protein-S-isoprenylcysteine O-methyltransferase Ste14
MELKLPPVIVFFCFALMMYVLNTVLPFGFFDFFGRLVLVKILIGLAVIVSLVSLGQFYYNRTTVDPTKPDKASSLVTNGIFSVSRNPMYFAMLLLLLALGLVLSNAFNTITAAGFVGYMNKFQIIPEERLLLEKFGKKYKEYVSRTRRWF